MKYPLRALLTLSLVLSACSGYAQSANQVILLDEEITPAPAMEQAKHPSERTQSTPEFCREISSKAGLLLMKRKSSPERYQIYPVDPLDGTQVCNFPLIEFNGYMSHALSAAGNTLAYFDAQSVKDPEGHLYFIDLESWKMKSTPVKISGWVHLMTFSPDGQDLAVVYADLSEGISNPASHFTVLLVNVTAQEVFARTTIDFTPRLMSYAQDARSLVLYGASMDPDADPENTPPQVAVLDGQNLKQVWSRSLPEIKDGVFRIGDGNDPEDFTQWQPGIDFDPRRNILYLIQADKANLVRVQIDNQKIQTQSIKPVLTWWEKFLNKTAGTAKAKVLFGTIKQAVLSPDGTTLYVNGFSGHPIKDERGNWQFNSEPTGLHVINASTSEEIVHLETQASDLSLSGEGQKLFLYGWDGNRPWTDIVHANDLTILKHIEGYHVHQGNLLGGEPLLLGRHQGSAFTRFSFFDLNSYEQLSDWQVMGDTVWLDHP